MEPWQWEKPTPLLQTTPRLRCQLLTPWCSSIECRISTTAQRREKSRCSAFFFCLIFSVIEFGLWAYSIWKPTFRLMLPYLYRITLMATCAFGMWNLGTHHDPTCLYCRACVSGWRKVKRSLWWAAADVARAPLFSCWRDFMMHLKAQWWDTHTQMHAHTHTNTISVFNLTTMYTHWTFSQVKNTNKDY